MKKEEAMKCFLEKEAGQASRSFVLGAMAYLRKEQLPERIREFTEDFREVFAVCRQEKEKGREVRFLQMSLLRSRALKGRPFYLLEAFDRNYYLSEPLAQKEMGLWWLYEGYGVFCREIRQESRRYIGSFREQELERICLAELADSKRMVKHLFVHALTGLLCLEEYRILEAGRGLCFQLGEYRGAYESLLETDEYTERLAGWMHGIS